MPLIWLSSSDSTEKLPVLPGASVGEGVPVINSVANSGSTAKELVALNDPKSASNERLVWSDDQVENVTSNKHVLTRLVAWNGPVLNI